MRFNHLLTLALAAILVTLFVAQSDANAGLILKKEKEVTPDEAEINRLTEAAGKGDGEAAFKLGKAYVAGNGVQADVQKAEEWFMKAIQAGNKEAGNQLGFLYLQTSDDGNDVERASKGLDILRTGAAEEATSNLSLGLLYLTGKYVTQSFDQAGVYFRKAAEMGDNDGYFYLGQMHSGDLGFEDRIQPKKALDYLEKASDAGNFEAARLLVKMLREGKHVVKDEKRAFDIVAKAAEEGNVKAQHFLGDLYESGSGVETNNAKARAAYIKAAEEGYAVAQNKLGLIYSQGLGGAKQDGQESVKWFEMAAKQGYPQSQLNLALLIDSKQNPTRQEEQVAAAYLISAANAGLTIAQDRLGSWYRDGRHVPRDFVAAQTWFTHAANGGNFDSKINLAQILEATAKEAKTFQTALQLYIDCANRGHPVAHYHIARVLLSGKLGRIDLIQAYAHIATAAEAGLPIAKESLPQLKEKLSEEQIAKGDEMRSKFKVVKLQ